MFLLQLDKSKEKMIKNSKKSDKLVAALFLPLVGEVISSNFNLYLNFISKLDIC